MEKVRKVSAEWFAYLYGKSSLFRNSMNFIGISGGSGAIYLFSGSCPHCGQPLCGVSAAAAILFGIVMGMICYAGIGIAALARRFGWCRREIPGRKKK